MKNFILKFSGALLILISLFLVGNNVKATNYFDEYQTGVHWLYQSSLTYWDISTDSPSDILYQQIAPWNICETPNASGNCEIDSVNFYHKVYRPSDGNIVIKLYEADTIPTSRATLGTLKRTILVPTLGYNTEGVEYLSLQNSYATFNLFEMIAEKFYTYSISAETTWGFSDYGIPLYEDDVRTDFFTKYYNINDTYPSWRNTPVGKYDIQLWFGLSGEATGYTFQDWDDIKAHTGLEEASLFNITPKDHQCIATSSPSEPCQFNVNYSTYLSGDNVRAHLFRQYVTGQAYSFSDGIATTTLYNGYNITTISVPYSSDLEDETIKYSVCISFDGVLSEICIDDISVWWLGTKYNEWFDYNYGYLFEEKDDPCLDVATSSETYADDFRYGMECGARKVLTWFISPTPESLHKLKLATDNIQNEFPLNVIYGLKAPFDSDYATTTAQILPVLDQNAEVIGYVIDEEKIRNSKYFWIVPDLKSIFSIVIYFLLGLYIILRIISMARKKEE